MLTQAGVVVRVRAHACKCVVQVYKYSVQKGDGKKRQQITRNLRLLHKYVYFPSFPPLFFFKFFLLLFLPSSFLSFNFPF
jgi:hypothetical protein